MTRVGLAVHRTFHAVRHSRNFRLFFAGQAVSVTGTWVQYVAASWLVLRLTGSGVALGVVTALTFAPILLFGAWAGVLADRHDKRRILLGTQIGFAVLALALWALVATGVVELWMVYALSFLQGVVTAIDNPARQSFFVEMVGSEHLTNAVSLNSQCQVDVIIDDKTSPILCRQFTYSNTFAVLQEHGIIFFTVLDDPDISFQHFFNDSDIRPSQRKTGGSNTIQAGLRKTT